MLDLKPYGAFIENTIRPLLEETRGILSEVKKVGLPVNQESLERLLASLFKSHLVITLLTLVKEVAIVIVISITAYAILK